MFKLMLPSVLLFVCFSGPASSATEGTSAAAQRVAVGRARVHAVFRDCAPRWRNEGLDARYLRNIWDSERFDVFEGVRLTLDQRSQKRTRPQASAGGRISRATCAGLLAGDLFAEQGINGVADSDLQTMREVYAASRPDPHQIRDHSLHAECMKINFNAHEVDYPSSLHLCDCTLSAMRAVPDDELDSWLELAHNGVDVPISEQAWYSMFVSKLLACSSAL